MVRHGAAITLLKHEGTGLCFPLRAVRHRLNARVETEGEAGDWWLPRLTQTANIFLTEGTILPPNGPESGNVGLIDHA
jgi:hypothetical protein